MGVAKGWLGRRRFLSGTGNWQWRVEMIHDAAALADTLMVRKRRWPVLNSLPRLPDCRRTESQFITRERALCSLEDGDG